MTEVLALARAVTNLCQNLFHTLEVLVMNQVRVVRQKEMIIVARLMATRRVSICRTSWRRKILMGRRTVLVLKIRMKKKLKWTAGGANSWFMESGPLERNDRAR